MPMSVGHGYTTGDGNGSDHGTLTATVSVSGAR